MIYGSVDSSRKNLYLKFEPADFQILFDKDFFFPVKRKKQFSNSDILGYVGGFLGLFAGISILSVIEIVYHLLVDKINEVQVGHENVLNGHVVKFLQESSIHSFVYVHTGKKFQK